MKLYYSRTSSDPIYYIQQGIRNGKKTTTRNVARIGRHSELLKITDDPLEYAKQQVAKYNQEAKEKKSTNFDLNIDFSEPLQLTDNVVTKDLSLNIGYFYLQHMYHDLKISDFFKDVCSDKKVTFDVNNINRFLTCARILWPQSKLGTKNHLNVFYEQPDIEYQHILRMMDILEENYEKYISYLYNASTSIVKRDTSVCYYDCTNFYFEIEAPDLDYVDTVTGEVIKGFRKYGQAKQHQPAPLVEMGLFVDKDGIPLSMCIVPGNQNEQTTAIPLEKQLTTMLNKKKFIYCSDGGLGSYHIRNFNSMGGRAFVVTQSIKKLSDKLKEAVFNDYDYKRLSDDTPMSIEAMKSFDKTDEKNKNLYNDRIYKLISADNLMDTGLEEFFVCKNGKIKKRKVKGTLKQNIIVTFSRKTQEYQRYIRERQIERAQQIIDSMDPDEYKKGPNDITRFIKRLKKDEHGNEIEARFVIDNEKIAEEAQYDGFYAVATNLDDDAKSILKIASGRNQIENCFRVMKSNFDARPVYHHKKPRIIAHFMICYTALLIYGLIDKKLKKKSYHFPIDQVLETMRAMSVCNVKDLFYISTHAASTIQGALNDIFPDLNLIYRYYQPKDLNKKIKKISR